MGKKVQRRRRGGLIESRSNRPPWYPQRKQRITVIGTRGRFSIPEIPGFLFVLAVVIVFLIIVL